MTADWAAYTDALTELLTLDERERQERERIETAYHAAGVAARREAEDETARLAELEARVSAFGFEVERLAIGVPGLSQPDPDQALIPVDQIARSLAIAERALRKVVESRDWLARYAAQTAQRSAPPVAPSAAPAPAPEPTPAPVPRRKGAVVIAVIVAAVVVVAVVVGVVIGVTS